MAKKRAESGAYRVTEIIGTSPTSWEDAARAAVETAAASCATCASRKSTSST